MNDKADSKRPALVRAWRNVITKPNRAEELVVELDREIELFHVRRSDLCCCERLIEPEPDSHRNSTVSRRQV